MHSSISQFRKVLALFSELSRNNFIHHSVKVVPEVGIAPVLRSLSATTGRMGWMAHWKWKEIKQQPGTAGPGNMLGSCLVPCHFRCDIHPIRPVHILTPSPGGPGVPSVPRLPLLPSLPGSPSVPGIPGLPGFPSRPEFPDSPLEPGGLEERY